MIDLVLSLDHQIGMIGVLYLDMKTQIKETTIVTLVIGMGISGREVPGLDTLIMGTIGQIVDLVNNCQGQGCNKDSYQGNNNNYGTRGYGKNQYNQLGRKGQNRGYRQTDNYPKHNGNNGCQPQSYSSNGQNQCQYSNTNPTYLSDLSSFVNQDGVTFDFDDRRHQVFQNACTEE